LRCPACHGEVDLAEAGATCVTCDVIYPHRDGYWDFVG
jgi:hypothetical protein